MGVTNEQIFEQLRYTYERVKEIEQRIATRGDTGRFEQVIRILEQDSGQSTATLWVSKPFSTLNLDNWTLSANCDQQSTLWLYYHLPTGDSMMINAVMQNNTSGFGLLGYSLSPTLFAWQTINRLQTTFIAAISTNVAFDPKKTFVTLIGSNLPLQ